MPHKTGPTTGKPVNSTPIVNKIELAKTLGSWPIFGASAPLGAPAVTDPPAVIDPAAPPAGGSAPPADDPIAKLVADPAAVTQLLAQVTELQNAVTAAQTENATFKQKEADAARAQQTLEQQQQTDIENLKVEMAKRDNIIKAKTIENAIVGQTEYQWNSVRQMMAELDMGALEVNIDIDKGIAEVKNMGAQLKTIAEKNPWLLKPADPIVDPAAPPAPPAPRQRGSGQPPRPPAAPQDKDAKRREAMKRMPVLQGGRARVM
jgi:hypothetical protein